MNWSSKRIIIIKLTALIYCKKNFDRNLAV